LRLSAVDQARRQLERQRSDGVATDNKSAVSIGLTHDFSNGQEVLSIDGRAETVEDV